MLETIFTSAAPTGSQVAIGLACSLAIGFMIAFCYMFKARYTKSFARTLALIPCAVSSIILLVNGNIGSGIAVAGAFSLVRFRSEAGSAQEIGAIFIAMGAGLACGMGYIAFAFVFAGVMCVVWLLCTVSGFGKMKSNGSRTLRIAVPEDLEYTTAFSDLMEKYASSSSLVKVKTSNLGSIFSLTYNLSLKDPSKEKEFIDALRCRNGNLEICIGCEEPQSQEL